MITTVTPNAAMDRALVVPNFMPGRRHRASSGVTLPGGKGVASARALKRLGSPVIATGLVGGLTGSNIVERLTDEGILNDFVRIAEPSRTSTAVIDPMSGAHTEINEHGPRVQPHELELLSEKLRYLARASRCVAFSGTLPRDVPTDLYQRLIRMLLPQSIYTAVIAPDDTEVLRDALAAEPTLVIIEQREAESLVGYEFSAAEDFIIGISEMAKMGGNTIIVMHEHGCHARVWERRSATWYSASHEPTEAVSELGNTDVFAAGYLNAWLADRPATERIAFGLGAALANRRSLGAGVFEKSDAIRHQREIDVSAIEPAEIEVD